MYIDHKVLYLSLSQRATGWFNECFSEIFFRSAKGKKEVTLTRQGIGDFCFWFLVFFVLGEGDYQEENLIPLGTKPDNRTAGFLPQCPKCPSLHQHCSHSLRTAWRDEGIRVALMRAGGCSVTLPTSPTPTTPRPPISQRRARAVYCGHICIKNK